MPLDTYEDCLELSTVKSHCPRSDNMWRVKANVNVVRVAKLGRYFSYLGIVIQVQVEFNSVQIVIKNLNQFLKGFSNTVLAHYSKKIV